MGADGHADLTYVYEAAEQVAKNSRGIYSYCYKINCSSRYRK